MPPLKKYETIQKVTCIVAFFTSFNFVSQFYSITSRVLFPKLH